MNNRRRGFTLIELGVVVIVIVTFASLIVPRFISIQRSRQVWEFEQALQRLAGSAHEEAINRSHTMVLTFDEAQNQFSLSVEADPSSSTSSGPLTLQGNSATTDQRQVVYSAKLPQGTVVQQYQAQGQPSNSGSWQIQFFADGTCDAGGVELSEDGALRTLYLDPRGTFKFSTEALPDPKSLEWDAGDFQRRA